MPFGLLNGCAELALKKPPPLVPSCLIASCEASGPPGIACSVIAVAGSAASSGVWSTVTATTPSPRFWMTPWEISTTANTRLSGSRMRRTVRTRSTQKLPSRREPVRVMPRISAISDGHAGGGGHEVLHRVARACW